MTVKQLIKQLSKLDPKAQVYLSSDPEGNSFNKMHRFDYAKGFERPGERSWDESPFYDEEEEEEIPKNAKPAIILFP